MRSIKNIISILVLVTFWFFSQSIQAQTVKDSCIPDTTSTAYDFNNWINCRVRDIATAKINQGGVNKQVQTPSIGDATTSLVDQTEAPDLVGFALNLAGISSDSDDESKNANSITTSAYALYAVATKNDPLDPTFYTKNSDLRRFSFTYGREAVSETNPNSATLLGFKVLLINKRDASRLKNRVELNKAAEKLKKATVDFSAITDEVQTYIYKQLAPSLGYAIPARGQEKSPAAFQEYNRFIREQLDYKNIIATINLLDDKQQAHINDIITEGIDSQVELDKTNREVIEKIRTKPQLSFGYQTKQSSGNGDDEHRAGLIFDFGISRRINFALNGTFDYKDSKTIGGDTRGGRFATELYYQPFADKRLFNGKDPLLVSFSGESKWMSNIRPTYQSQFKVTIPIFEGVSIPLSVSYANQKNLIKESKVRGNFGFTFDLAKIIKGFKP